MKKNLFAKTVLALGLAVTMLLSPMAAMASETATAPEVARTKAWDSINTTLGGTPKSVRKIEYKGSVFYLGNEVTDADFQTVLAVGPEAVRMEPLKDSGKLYYYTVYILWNSDKTVLLVHPIIYDYDLVLEAVAIPQKPPANLTDSTETTNPPQVTLTETQEYMLSDEYADAVRTEFYRLLNEHRAANGLRELDVNLELQDYADIRADELRIQKGHVRPDGTPAGSGWHNSHNVIQSRYAENALATGTLHPDPLNTALGIFSTWRDSEGHNKHMLYSFKPEITMALGFAPKLDENGRATSGAIFASGY